MLSLILILVLVSVYFEAKIVSYIPMLGSFLERYKIAALIFSLGLSIILGSFFGAAGLIVLAAGLLSTMVIQPWYRMRKAGVFDALRVEVDARREVIDKRIYQGVQLIKAVCFVVYLPFKIIFGIMDLTDSLANALKKGIHNVKR